MSCASNVVSCAGQEIITGPRALYLVYNYYHTYLVSQLVQT